jgi:Phage integrase, N-terminal SAM-like domain
MTAGIELAEAITGLVAEKRALGYKYRAEERVLARFEAFCASEFSGLDTVTRASVEAWVASARQRTAKPATVNNLIAPVRELARWLGRRFPGRRWSVHLSDPGKPLDPGTFLRVPPSCAGDTTGRLAAHYQ